jgi:adenylate kinase
MLHTVIFIGRSGCGKGTQADLLKDRIARLDPEKHHILYLETGEYFRKFIKEKSFSSELSKKSYEEDNRQPDFLACWMWSNALVEELMPNMHVVFDGAPRSLSEANIITTAMKFYKREKPAVIYLNVSRKWSEEKLLSRGRVDDGSLSQIDKRLDWFEEDTLPAIEYFKKNSFYQFIEVDGEQPIEKVHKDIIDSYGDSA